MNPSPADDGQLLRDLLKIGDAVETAGRCPALAAEHVQRLLASDSAQYYPSAACYGLALHEIEETHADPKRRPIWQLVARCASLAVRADLAALVETPP